jgi:tetratricopeptide (TPR) repeat protein
MNALPAVGAADAGAPTIDERNPWLGLASFTEETRAYFYGRDEEVAELARRVQRKLLTVLFGQSGLGKTSILRAGLVPRLREQGYCPVYVRVDYGRDAPEPAEQIKQAITRSARRAGEWTQAGVAAAGESLWEYLHHRDDVLRDEAGKTLIPLLIFDQFEEIFTLAQSDDFGRARAATFIADLADLVENRAPKAVEQRLEADETLAERFDFARGDYRVLISLREDYLAPLEGLKTVMPSITQNRLRLAPMTGAQALTAVMRPGRGLVSEEVAAAIVRFVAGGAELANAEVEPSLLSLICRELNDARLAQGRGEISLDLLAGSHATILSNFYERSLADQPPAVRRIIEDELLTASGYRENIAEERLVSDFAAAGAAPGTLALLVNRRLLRIEERLDARRVELTHDVLCGVVKYSRDQRKEREARAATERMLAEQRARELAARHALVRARQVAAVCVLLAAGAIVAAGIAYLSRQRAHRAEQVAEQARAGSEHLLGYLTDDFVRELESFGRLNVVAEFTRRQIDYFHGLPPALKGPETIRNGALAMVHFARAKRVLGDLGTAGASATEAIGLLEQQRATGDESEATTIALALAYTARAQVLDNSNDPGGPVAGARAAELLRPLAEMPGASAAARRAYVEVLVRKSYEQWASLQNEDAVRTASKSQHYAEELGALNLHDLNMAAFHAEAGAWLLSGLINLGRNDQARRVGEDAVALADRVLEQRPGYRLALHAQQVILSGLASVAQNDMNPLEAVRVQQRGEQVSLSLLKLDPDSTTSMNNLGVARQTLGDSYWAAGRLREAIAAYKTSLDDYGHATVGGSGFFMIRAFDVLGTAFHQAQLGDAAAAAATLASGVPYLERLRKEARPGGISLVITSALGQVGTAAIALERGDFADARRVAGDAEREFHSIKPHGSFEISQTYGNLYFAQYLAGRAAYEQGDYAAAEKSMRAALASRKVWGTQAIPDRRDLGEVTTWLAMAVARQGKLAEAADLIRPVVQFRRELAARNHGDQWVPVDLASALYVQSLTEPAQAAELRRQAAALLETPVAAVRDLRDVRQWRARVAAARAAS